MSSKNSVSAILSALLIPGLALLSSCGGSADDEQYFSFQSYTLTSVAKGADTDSLRLHLKDFNGLWNVSTSGIMPVKVGPHEITALTDSLAAMSCVNFDAGAPAIVLPRELQALPKDSAASDSLEAGSSLMVRTTLDLLTPVAAVFRVFTYSYPEGAAHGVYSNRYLNFDVAGGSIITLSTLFNPGYERVLQPMIVERLKEAHSTLLVEDDEIEIPQVFRITSDGIEFIYGIYAIAPYSEGEPTVSFNAYELADLLTPTGKALLTP